MFKRKSIGMLLVGLFALAGCVDTSISIPGSNTEDSTPSTSTAKPNVRLQVWGPIAEEPLYQKHATEFQALHSDIQFRIDYGNVGEPDAAAQLLSDPDVGADVFFYADDNTAKMANRGVLAELPEVYKNRVIARDSEAAVDNAIFDGDGKMYAFPVTADNGYFLVYNKKFFPNPEDTATLERILEITVANEHQFVVDLGNGYYATSFIQHISNISYDPLTETHQTNFNSEASIDAMQGVIDLLRPAIADGRVLSEDFNGDALSELSDSNDNKVIAGVTGHWNTQNILDILGDDFGAAKLPTFKNSKGAEVQWGSFMGSKLVGVKASSSNLTWALAFADYITDEAAQLYRFQESGWGPTNKAAQLSDDVQANPGLAALTAQAPYSISQAKSVGGIFWDNAANIGNFIKDGPASETSPQTLKAVLDAFVAAMTTSAS